jgi:hypothetical protein
LESSLPAAPDSPFTLGASLLNQELPTWLRFSGEERARVEGWTGITLTVHISRLAKEHGQKVAKDRAAAPHTD